MNKYMPEHTKEPWRTDVESGTIIFDMDRALGLEIIAVTFSDYDEFKQAQVNARRIVACVNACAGMADPKAWIDELKEQRDNYKIHCDGWEKQYRLLESGFNGIKSRVDKADAERDELLAALEDIARTEQSHCYGTDSEVNDLMQTRFDLRKCGDKARAAILKLKDK